MTANLTILEALAKWNEIQPNKSVWNFLDDHGKMIDSFTYKELDRVSTSLAAYLLFSSNIKHNDRVLLVFMPGLHYCVTLLACFKAGIIAVPVFPPDPRRLEKDMHHFVSISNSSGAQIALTHNAFNFNRKLAGIRNIFAAQKKSWPELKWIEVDDVISRSKSKSNTEGPKLPGVIIARADIAFLQYTSGSTSDPKGVMITHENLAHNETIIIKELQANSKTICVSWLPQYHDMGLIGSYLGCLYCGGTGYYLSPISFLKDPVVWIHSMSLYQGTHTQAPNFAYALVTRKFKEAINADSTYAKTILNLNLSSVQSMLNAAEPVDEIAINNFYTTFEIYGLKQGVVVPTYGLAEHTVFVCSRGISILSLVKSEFEKNIIVVSRESRLGDTNNSNVGKQEKTDALVHTVVGCGYPTMDNDIDVFIANDSFKQLEEDQIGEIWIKSPSKAKGYWNMPELTAEEFDATLTRTNSRTEGGYLRTGDLGFLHRGELFICGRLKDLIIVRGTNHYPQDIEKSAEQKVSELRPGCSAAFAIPSDGIGAERVIYVAELKEGISQTVYVDILQRIRNCISSEHGFTLSSICLLETRSIPKTTSGKIARAWCRRAFLEKSLKIISRYDSQGDDQGLSDVFDVEDVVGGINSVDIADMSNRPTDAPLTAEEIRALPLPDIVSRLETMLVRISSQSGAGILAPINPEVAISTLGLDSLTLVQFNGVLQKKFYCPLPDEFIFSSLATLTELSKSVKAGGLTHSQKVFMEATPGEEGQKNTAPVAPKTPLCPWFTCCY